MQPKTVRFVGPFAAPVDVPAILARLGLTPSGEGPLQVVLDNTFTTTHSTPTTYAEGADGGGGGAAGF